MTEKTAPLFGRRTRAYLEFLAAIVLFFLVRSIARHGAAGLSNATWSPLIEQVLLLSLLLAGYAAFGRLFNRQRRPVGEQGLPFRQEWRSEAGVGVAAGWALAVLCVLPLTVIGGVAIVFSPQASAWGWLLVDTVFFAIAAMVEEVAFRGYGFQRFQAVVGSAGAAIGFAVFYAVLEALQPGSSRLSVAVSTAFSLVLTLAYLRTRALWVSWGLNFGWKASRALIFGLTVSGVSGHSSVVEGDPMGPRWLTGGGYGLDGSWIALFGMAAAAIAVYHLTRELDFRYNAPVIVPAGIPVDLDAAARREHEASSEARPESDAAPSLVQILPASINPASNGSETQKSGPEGA